MKKLSVLLFALLFGLTSWAQGGNGEKVKQLKIEFIAERLQLSPQQSKQFWPLYEQYEAEMKALRRSIRKKYELSGGDMKDKVAMVNYISNSNEYITKRQTIRERFKAPIQQAITLAQYNKLIQAENDFRNRLIKQLQSGE